MASTGPSCTANHETEWLAPNYRIVPGRENAINAGLRWLGVRSGEAIDEFAAIGLDRLRWTDEWAAVAS